MIKNSLLSIGLILLMGSFALAAEEAVLATGQGDEAAPIVAAAPTVVEAVAATPAVTPAAAKAESEIPLAIDVTKKASETASMPTRLFLTVFILLGILGATYFMVRKYKLSNGINKSNKQIKIISQHFLGPKKSLAIIHVAGESILIGVTDSNISMIKSLSLIDDEVPADMPQNFSDTLQLKNQDQHEPAAGATANPEELEEEFSFAGVKDTVSKKLKSMRNF